MSWADTGSGGGFDPDPVCGRCGCEQFLVASSWWCHCDDPEPCDCEHPCQEVARG
jgi:hypothetical protein